MKHQLIETWLFNRDELSPDEDRALEEHLASCEHCCALAAAWNEVKARISLASLETPAPGFTRRWRMRLEKSRRQADQRQLGALLLCTTVGLTALTLLIGAELLPLLQLVIPIILEWFGKIANVIAHLNIVWEILSILATIMLEAVPFVYRVALPLSLTVLSALWFASLYRLNYSRIKRE